MDRWQPSPNSGCIEGTATMTSERDMDETFADAATSWMRCAFHMKLEGLQPTHDACQVQSQDPVAVSTVCPKRIPQQWGWVEAQSECRVW
jgi:hypothetical protein